jgi:DNA-binding transcriptional LysR family regulator
MTLEQMRIFVEAARYNSFSLAAQKLSLTQAAVSSSIRKLEDEFGVSLFDRLGRKVVVSEAGQILLGEAERILGDVDLTTRRIRGYRKAGRDQTIIACSHNAYDYWMPGIVARIKSDDASPHIELIRGAPTDVAAWVMRGTADAGISEARPGHAEFRYYNVFEDPVVLCAAPDTAKANPSVSRWDDLPNAAPILWETGTALERIILDAFEERGMDHSQIVHPMLRLQSTAAVITALAWGRWLGFAPRRAARAFLAKDELTAIGRIEVPVQYWIFASRDREIEPLAALIANAALKISST